MTRRMPTPGEWITLKVRCDFCGAIPRRWCVNHLDPEDGWAQRLHSERVRLGNLTFADRAVFDQAYAQVAGT